MGLRREELKKHMRVARTSKICCKVMHVQNYSPWMRALLYVIVSARGLQNYNNDNNAHVFYSLYMDTMTGGANSEKNNSSAEKLR